jgi:hypothetical protein
MEVPLGMRNDTADPGWGLARGFVVGGRDKSLAGECRSVEPWDPGTVVRRATALERCRRLGLVQDTGTLSKCVLKFLVSQSSAKLCPNPFRLPHHRRNGGVLVVDAGVLSMRQCDSLKQSASRLTLVVAAVQVVEGCQSPIEVWEFVIAAQIESDDVTSASPAGVECDEDGKAMSNWALESLDDQRRTPKVEGPGMAA